MVFEFALWFYYCSFHGLSETSERIAPRFCFVARCPDFDALLRKHRGDGRIQEAASHSHIVARSWCVLRSFDWCSLFVCPVMCCSGHGLVLCIF